MNATPDDSRDAKRAYAAVAKASQIFRNFGGELSTFAEALLMEGTSTSLEVNGRKRTAEILREIADRIENEPGPYGTA